MLSLFPDWIITIGNSLSAALQQRFAKNGTCSPNLYIQLGEQVPLNALCAI